MENLHSDCCSGQSVPSPTRLAVFENRVYWSDSTKQGIMSVNKYEGSTSIQTVYKNREVKDPKAVKIVHFSLQKLGKKSSARESSKETLFYFWMIDFFGSSCLADNMKCFGNNGGCQHMCIVTKVSESDEVGYRCACNIGWALAHDLKTCTSKRDKKIFQSTRCSW